MTFKTKVQVRFAHVDAAGIVFYPRYFEMLNGAVEDWFASMGCDFRRMHLEQRMGVPTVRLECEFVAPSELGDELTIQITPVRVGRSSCTINYLITGDDKVRVTAEAVLVCTDLDAKRAVPWPEPLQRQLSAAGAIAESPLP
jgi:4-hydroxybenzoyl-CoA thioesterase